MTNRIGTVMLRKRGFTLVETLVVMVILAFIGSAVMAFHVTGARLTVRVGNESSAEKQLARAIPEISKHVRAARAITLTGSSRIEVAVPATDGGTGVLLLPQRTGGYVAYYLSNSSGDPHVTGNYLWRATKGPLDTDQWVAEKSIAKNVDSLAFTYSADKSQVTVTLETQTGRGTYQVVNKQSSLIKLRNKLQ